MFLVVEEENPGNYFGFCVFTAPLLARQPSQKTYRFLCDLQPLTSNIEHSGRDLDLLSTSD